MSSSNTKVDNILKKKIRTSTAFKCILLQKQPQEVFHKKIGVLKNLAKFTGKHPYKNLFFIKKETQALVFPCELKNTFSTVLFQTAASVIVKFLRNIDYACLRE